MRTFDEYKEKLYNMRKNVYIGGQLRGRDDELFKGGINTIGVTFDAAQDPENKGKVTATSHVTGKEINRFSHIYQNEKDLLEKQKMIRNLAGKVGGCIQRCMGCDVMNALYVTTKEIDAATGTTYHENFVKYLKYYQENDLIGNAAQTDVKGDRSKRPSEQADPDLYVRVVEKREDGIIVSGCKAHNTTAPYADEIIAVPTRVMGKGEGDWAVAFAVPADSEGVTLVCRSTGPRGRNELKAPFNEFGCCDSMTVFDNVFVPWDRVFMCGESKFAGRLALAFANNHRFSYCGCKPAVTDIIMGATAMVADYNGIGKQPHVIDDLSELMVTAELVYAAGIAAAVTSSKTISGAYEPNFLYSNCGRFYAGVNIYHEYDVLASTAGGLPATLPPEADFFNEDTKAYMDKYIMRNPDISAENQHRLFRFISDFSCSAWSGVFQYAGVHGGGSPIMEKIGIRTFYDLQSKKNLVKGLAGIEVEKTVKS
jgi:aromatic ring hydroxylase